jgi:hypothetical protein
MGLVPLTVLRPNRVLRPPREAASFFNLNELVPGLRKLRSRCEIFALNKDPTARLLGTGCCHSTLPTSRAEFQCACTTCTHELGKRAAELTDRTRLFVIAEAWLDLADRVGRATRQPTCQAIDNAIDNAAAEHPLVTNAFGSDADDDGAARRAIRLRRTPSG